MFKLSKSHIDNIILAKKNNGNKMFMQNNSDMTRSHEPRFTSLRLCSLDTYPLILIDNVGLKWTIYGYI